MPESFTTFKSCAKCDQPGIRNVLSQRQHADRHDEKWRVCLLAQEFDPKKFVNESCGEQSRKGHDTCIKCSSQWLLVETQRRSKTVGCGQQDGTTCSKQNNCQEYKSV